MDNLDELRTKLLILVRKLYSVIGSKVLVYGFGVSLALVVTSAITSAISSIPLVPELMQLVGLGFTVWFSCHNLVLKERRDELFAKIEELNQQIFGYGG